MSALASVSAVNRFGLGAIPGEIAQARDARGWLHAQLEAGPERAAFAALPASGDVLVREAAARRARRQAAREGEAGLRGNDMPGNGMPGKDMPRNGMGYRALVRDALEETALRQRVAATTRMPFAERLVRFWSNHFAVSVDKRVAQLYAAPMEREAIRPHVLGDFADLLLAVERHPAMLRYLDNVASVGEGSRRARRAARNGRMPGLNENLAREILELHTLGVEGGYAQQDVRELAMALTGWTVDLRGDGSGSATGFAFLPATHEPGARTVLGRRFEEAGVAQGEAILRHLAVQPSTARHLAFKLARHFVSDAPPPALVERMARAYLDAGGALRPMYAALVDHDAAWSAQAVKFKTPDDFVVSAMRAGARVPAARARAASGPLRDLGQPLFTPRSPEGFPDTFADWAAGDALRRRLQLATGFAATFDTTLEPLALALDVLGAPYVDDTLASALRRAGSPQDGFALLLASPAFQWRT